MQNQPQRKGGGDDGLMIIGALLIMITVMWFGFRDYVIYGVCRLLYWIYGVLPDAITPGNAAERRDMLLSAARYNHQVSLWDFISVMNDTASVLFPLFILILSICASHFVFRRRHLQQGKALSELHACTTQRPGLSILLW